jgi:hypothetical protein
MIADDGLISIPTGFVFCFTRAECDNFNHPYVVISSTQESEIVVVNFTTYRKFSDGSCIVSSGEHECITHQTCIAYERAKRMPLADLERMLRRGDIEPKSPASRDLLCRIWDGAQRTRHLAIGIKRMLQEQNLIEDW